MTIQYQRKVAVLHAVSSFDDLIVAVQRTGHEIPFSGRAATLDFDAVRAGNDFPAMAGRITLEYKARH
jgi:hypothetical protein